MLGVYITLAVAAILIITIFVDQLPENLVPRENEICTKSVELLLGTLKHLRHKEQLLLIPLTMYSGFEQASHNAEFTKVRR